MGKDIKAGGEKVEKALLMRSHYGVRAFPKRGNAVVIRPPASVVEL